MQMRETPEAKRAGCSAIQDAASYPNQRPFPVSISQAAISGVPAVRDQRLPNGRLWQATWRLDDIRRQLLLVCVAADRGQRVTQLADTGDMMNVLFGTPKERRRLAPKIHSTGDLWIWNGDVEWTLGSILAPIKPNISDPSTYRNGKCRLGPDRRNCIAFVWKDDARSVAAGGVYCRDEPAGSQLDPLDTLEMLDLRICGLSLSYC